MEYNDDLASSRLYKQQQQFLVNYSKENNNVFILLFMRHAERIKVFIGTKIIWQDVGFCIKGVRSGQCFKGANCFQKTSEICHVSCNLEELKRKIKCRKVDVPILLTSEDWNIICNSLISIGARG